MIIVKLSGAFEQYSYFKNNGMHNDCSIKFVDLTVLIENQTFILVVFVDLFFDNTKCQFRHVNKIAAGHATFDTHAVGLPPPT